MNDYLELPNIEAAVNEILKAAGLRVFSSIPGDAAALDPDVAEVEQPHAYPLAVTQRLGGSGGERHALDAARIQIDAWGTNKKTALDTIRTAWRALHEAEATSVELADDERVWISGVDDETKPQWLPDGRTARDRYVAGFAVYSRQVDPIAEQFPPLLDDFNRADHAEPLGAGWGADSLWGGLAVVDNAADAPDGTGGQMWATVLNAPCAVACRLLNGSNWFYMSLNEPTPPAPGAGGFELEIQPAPDHIWTLYENTGTPPDFPHYGAEFGVEQIVAPGDEIAVTFDGTEAAAWWRAAAGGPWVKVTYFDPPNADDYQSGRAAIFTSAGYPVDDFRAGEGSAVPVD